MLDIDTLNALEDLMARTLYQAEVNHLPKLTRAEEKELVARARRGDVEARAELVISCLRYALGRAISLFTARQPRHDEALDLAQVASLAMVTHLDTALTKNDPGSYLRGIARKEMAIYIVYGASHFRMPHFTLAQFAERGGIPTVESLSLKIDIIEAPMPTEAQPERFKDLYAALDTLPPQLRDRIIWRFHLDRPAGPQPPEGSSIRYPLAKLRKALEDRLRQMVEPEQEE